MTWDYSLILRLSTYGLRPKDFIKMLTNLEYYIGLPMEFDKSEDVGYPVGKLEDVRIYFQHYQAKEQARDKWEERKMRIDYNNLYIIFSDRDGCTYENVKEFDSLPYKHKIVFCNNLKSRPDYTLV